MVVKSMTNSEHSIFPIGIFPLLELQPVSLSQLSSISNFKLKQPKKNPLSSLSKMSELWIQCFGCCVADRPPAVRIFPFTMLYLVFNFINFIYSGVELIGI